MTGNGTETMATRYYLVRVDFEYMVDHDGEYTTKKTEAGRVRVSDKDATINVLKELGIMATLVPTSYKLGKNEFLYPSVLYFCRKNPMRSRVTRDSPGPSLWGTLPYR